MRNSQVIDTVEQGKARIAEFAAQDRDEKALDEARRTANRGFVQVYPKGWKRLQRLIQTNPGAARIYAFLAEHIDDACGAVVVSQEVIARELGVHKRTIIRLSKELEVMGAVVRIRVGTGIYAYCLDPTEIWRSWDDKKDCAAFVTKTLVLKSDRENGEVRRKLKVMMGE
jgi:DNA-binding transcriptional ArsR family regulator